MNLLIPIVKKLCVCVCWWFDRIKEELFPLNLLHIHTMSIVIISSMTHYYSTNWYFRTIWSDRTNRTLCCCEPWMECNCAEIQHRAIGGRGENYSIGINRRNIVVGTSLFLVDLYRWTYHLIQKQKPFQNYLIFVFVFPASGFLVNNLSSALNFQ